MTVLLSLLPFLVPPALPFSATWTPGQPLPVLIDDAPPGCVLMVEGSHGDWISQTLETPGIINAAALLWGESISSDGPELPLESLLFAGQFSLGIWCAHRVWTANFRVDMAAMPPFLPYGPGRSSMHTVAGLHDDLLVAALITVHDWAPETDIARREPDRIADRVRIEDAQAYADALSQAEGLPACYAQASRADCVGYRLPTAEEWAALNTATERHDFTSAPGEWEWVEDASRSAFIRKRIGRSKAGRGAPHAENANAPWAAFRLVRYWPNCTDDQWQATCRPTR